MMQSFPSSVTLLTVRASGTGACEAVLMQNQDSRTRFDSAIIDMDMSLIAGREAKIVSTLGGVLLK